MMCSQGPRAVVAGVILGLLCLTGCPKPEGSGGAGGGSSPSTSGSKDKTPPAFAKKATANADDVKAAKARIHALGSRSKYSPKEGELLTEIDIQDGSNLTADDLALFGKLSDLEKLQIYNCRT